jgi:hypothetical protein
MDRTICRRTARNSSGLRCLLLVAGLELVASNSTAFASQPCGTGSYPFPYTDVASVTDPFCPGIMEAYVTGVSKGTTPTTFSPNDNVTRLQMTTFLQRSIDLGLRRNSWRASAEQWWVPQNHINVQTISLAGAPVLCKPDRDSIWVAVGSTVVRIEASTGKVLGTWTGANGATGILVAEGLVFVTGTLSPGVIYVIDPTAPPGAVSTLPTTGAAIGNNPRGIAFDGAHIWTANGGSSVSIITLLYPSPSTVSTIGTGFMQPFGMVFDGSHMWVADLNANALFKLDGSGNIVQTVSTGGAPAFPVFDGTNIWVPDSSGGSGTVAVTVVQASTGAVVASITGDGSNKMDIPATAAFDGERILVTNQGAIVSSVTLFKAADLSLIGNIPTVQPGNPYGACSDGLNFWVTDSFTHSLLRI